MTVTAAAAESHRFTAFGGSQCEIHTVGVGSDAVSACIAEVYAFEQRLSRFRPDSELSRFNAAAGGGPVGVSALLAELLRVALDAYARTDGLVNAAVLPSLVAAGYDRSIEQVRRRDTTPAAAAQQASQPAPPLPDVLHVGDGWAQLAAGCAVDLGGVGKGWLADRLSERLGNAVVNLGGDLRARGDGWPTALCDGSTVVVRDGGVATSGTEGRHWRGGHHLIDPRTGRPADTDILAMSIVAADAETAETLAKAAAMLGSAAAPLWLREHGAARWAMRCGEVASA